MNLFESKYHVGVSNASVEIGVADICGVRVGVSLAY